MLLFFDWSFCVRFDVMFSILIVSSMTSTFYRDTRVCFLMIRRPPRSTLDRSSAASDVYKRQDDNAVLFLWVTSPMLEVAFPIIKAWGFQYKTSIAVSYTHLRAHETVLDLVCRLLLEKKQHTTTHNTHNTSPQQRQKYIAHNYRP